MKKVELIKQLALMPEHLPIKFYKGYIDRQEVVLPIKGLRLVMADSLPTLDEENDPEPLYILIY